MLHEIARGLSPFQPENLAIEAGTIMLGRMGDLLTRHADFAFETTLSSRTFMGFIDRAKNEGYTVTLLYFSLTAYIWLWSGFKQGLPQEDTIFRRM